jgi:hypothetical protein
LWVVRCFIEAGWILFGKRNCQTAGGDRQISILGGLYLDFELRKLVSSNVAMMLSDAVRSTWGLEIRADATRQRDGPAS